MLRDERAATRCVSLAVMPVMFVATLVVLGPGAQGLPPGTPPRWATSTPACRRTSSAVREAQAFNREDAEHRELPPSPTPPTRDANIRAVAYTSALHADARSARLRRGRARRRGRRPGVLRGQHAARHDGLARA